MTCGGECIHASLHVCREKSVHTCSARLCAHVAASVPEVLNPSVTHIQQRGNWARELPKECRIVGEGELEQQVIKVFTEVHTSLSAGRKASATLGGE